MKLRREIRECEIIPAGYGVSYRHYDRCVTICYPIPLNWLVRWLRAAWIFLAHPGFSTLDRLSAIRSAWVEEMDRNKLLKEENRLLRRMIDLRDSSEGGQDGSA